ncbi:MAG TPA: hypothetical protein DD740_12640 [Chryseobacterium sp.]|nr:hypothetical protein [Chryseobacterium sp.]
MNTRVLELIKNPKIITESDLDILASESEKTPYAQSIRALYLYGINLYQPEKYKENLSRTAAYTTDKKILYQFINSEKINKKEQLPNEQPTLEDTNIQSTKEIGKTHEEQITPEELPQKEIEEKPVNITDSNENIEAEKVSKPSYNISSSVTFTSANNIVYQINNTKTQSGKTGFPLPQTVVSKKVNERPAEEELSKPANPELIAEIEQTETPSLNKFDINKIIESEDQEGSEFIVVEGEKNRLLYEGEENFMAEQTPELDLEATAESGELTLKQENETVVTPTAQEENRPEEVMTENNNGHQTNEPVEDNKESTVKDENDDISFGGAQDFMPDVKFSVPKNHLDYLNPTKYEAQLTKEDQQTSHHYEEPALQEDLEIQDADAVSFAKTQAFDFANAEVVQNKAEDNTDDKIVIADIPEPEDNGWKPMQFSGNTPDALIGKPEKEPAVEDEPAVSEKFKIDLIEEPMAQDNEQENDPEENFVVEESTVETIQEPKEEELPVINVSFFGDDVSKIEDHKEIPATLPVEKPKQNDDSNVGRFINTWQNWLKIERNDQPQEKVTKKEKIIDNFIENNPKISQLKDENAYVIKERKDDISHLMTETLARLYTEQKLYTKAIKAYEILSKKHPEKKAYFEDKIEEVKEIRKP